MPVVGSRRVGRRRVSEIDDLRAGVRGREVRLALARDQQLRGSGVRGLAARLELRGHTQRDVVRRVDEDDPGQDHSDDRHPPEADKGAQHLWIGVSLVTAASVLW